VATGAEVGAAGCGPPQATNVTDNSNIRINRSFMAESPCEVKKLLSIISGISQIHVSISKEDDSLFSRAAV
jgi:hypothetical protein